MTSRKDRIRGKRRSLRVRSGLKRGSLPRVSVFRSAKHIYAQLIDDQAGKTLASVSTLAIETRGDKKEAAFVIGKQLADHAKKLGVEKALFDRGRFLYHGRVKKIAEGLREGGLNI